MVRFRLRSVWRTIFAYVALGLVLVIAGLSGRALYAMRLPDTALTREQRALPYAKYFHRPIFAPSSTMLAAISRPIDCKDALPVNDINTLLDPGYQRVESGYCVFPDGGGYASVLVKMPGVTLDMFNWWFIWHPQESLRYKMWDKDDHFSVRIGDADRRRFNDPTLPLPDRLWGSVHHIRENIGLPAVFRFFLGIVGGDPYAIDVHFLRPEECGFDMTRFDFSKESVVCASSGMRHYVRKTADGIELRSRFYDGYVRQNGVFVRGGPKAVLAIEAALNHHMLKEFTNLAHILPAVYAEEAARGHPAAK